MPSMRHYFEKLFKPTHKTSRRLQNDNVEAEAKPTVEPTIEPTMPTAITVHAPSRVNPKPIPPLTEHCRSPTSPIILARPDSAVSEQSRFDSKFSAASGHWLKDELRDARIEVSYRPHCFFIPKSVQEELINVGVVAKDIQAQNHDLAEDEAVQYASMVCSHARKLYATLAYIKKGSDICSLMDEGITDHDLPFLRKPNLQSRFALYRTSGDPIRSLEPWKDKYLEGFDRYQWWMTAPFFRLHGDLYELNDQAILPFVPLNGDAGRIQLKQGGYSDVFPVRIHPAHHDFWESSGSLDSEPLVAVKRLYNSDATEFFKEATILRALGLKNHPHLIKLLASYKHEGKYHFMFPYADANLRTYWDDRPSPTFDRDTVLWSLKQMTGVANGLLLIHSFTVSYPLDMRDVVDGVRIPKDVQSKFRPGEEFYGRHGDIKPENLLWFQSDRETEDPMGILQIADFGLGRFHGRDSRSGVNPETVVTSPTYEPPECKLRQPVSRAYDMWGLGCLYLEFITWLLRGSADIEDFSEFRGREATATGIDDDNFFTIITDDSGMTAIVRENVIIWTNELHTHENCSQLMHDLLNFIMQNLLVVEPKDRCRALFLYQQLRMFLNKAEHDEEYMLKPVPLPLNRGDDRSMLTSTIFGTTANHSKHIPARSTGNKRDAHTKNSVQTKLPIDLMLHGAGSSNFRERRLSSSTWPPR